MWWRCCHRFQEDEVQIIECRVMIRWIVLFAFLYGMLNNISAQENDQKYFVGGYYAFFHTKIYPDGTNDSVSTDEHFIDINFRYALNKVWRVGIEYNLGYMSNEDVDDPFSTFGVTLDYDILSILRAKKSKLHIRAGLSFSNLSFTDDQLPQKRFVFNRVFGASYEYRISNAFWVTGGFYHHFPFTKIEFKDAMVQPFAGVCVGI